MKTLSLKEFLMTQHIISIKSFGLTNMYLTWDEQKRKETCDEILRKAFSSMKVPASFEERKQIISVILQRSIESHEAKEDYEQCQILLEIKNAIKDFSL